MNTVNSYWFRWASLFVAGGGAYYFAKQQIRTQRQAKLEVHHQKIAANKASVGAGTSNGSPARTDNAGLPSQEASNDPAATRHAPATESERVAEKGKYESDTPYRPRKGDRFS